MRERVTPRLRTVYDQASNEAMKHSFLALLLLPFLPLWHADAAVNPAIIPPDARWVVYADLNALRASTVGKELVAIANKAQADNPVGINLEKLLATIGTATAYGSNFTDNPEKIDGTLVLQGTEDLRKIAESLVLQATLASPKTASESSDLPFPSYILKLNNHEGKSGAPADAVIVAFPPEPIVIVSKSRTQVLRARDVFRSSYDSLASTSGPLKGLVGMSGGAMIFAASVVPPDAVLPKDEPQARILKMTNSGAIAIGEKGENTVAHARLVATSDDMADKLMKIVQGMTAMLSLAETNDKQIADFISSAAVAREDRTVTLSLSYSSERLGQMIRSTQQHSPRGVAARREASRSESPLINGKPLAQWTATPEDAPDPDNPAKVLVRTVENAELKSGSVMLLGRRSNGGKNVRFSNVEITPAAGGAPLAFRPEYMMQVGSGQQQFQFPGADGTYTIKVSYQNDPFGKATYAIGVRQVAPPNSAPDSAVSAGKSSR